MKKTNTYGFSLIFTVSILVALVSITLAGFYIYSKSHNKNDNYIKDTVPSIDNSKDTTKNITESQSTNQKYLVIKEWGVQLPLSDEYSDIVYKYTSSNSITIQSETFAKLSNDTCPSTNTTPYLGIIDRYQVFANTNQKEDVSGPGDAPSKEAVKLGDYAYDYRQATQLYCAESDNSDALLKYFNSATSYLKGELKSLEIISSN